MAIRILQALNRRQKQPATLQFPHATPEFPGFSTFVGQRGRSFSAQNARMHLSGAQCDS
jgi:hypothetical protein